MTSHFEPTDSLVGRVAVIYLTAPIAGVGDAGVFGGAIATPEEIIFPFEAVADLRAALSPDAPVPVVEDVCEHARPGGAALTACIAARAGHTVTVFERDDRIGGLLRYGIPEYRLPRPVLDGEIRLIEEAGVTIETGRRIEALDELLEHGFDGNRDCGFDDLKHMDGDDAG